MADLLPQQIAQLHAGIVGGEFTADELRRVVRFRLGWRMEDHIGIDGRGLDAVVFDLVTRVAGTGEWPDLVRALADARPKATAFLTFCESILPGGLTAPEVRPLVDRAVNGLLAIASAINDPAVADTVDTFRDDFDLARSNITLMKKYKGLHDALHVLQLQLTEVTSAAEKFATDPNAALLLERFVRLIRVQANKAAADCRDTPTQELESAWVAEFADYTTDVRGALAALDADGMTKALDGLKRLLVEAPRINSLLITAARGLKLKRIVDALEAIRASVEAKGGPVATFAGGETGLRELTPRLAGLIELHNEWQRVDRALAVGDSLAGATPAALVPRWAVVEPQVRNLCKLFAGAELAVDLDAALDRFAAPAADADVVRRAYKSVRFAGILFFFQVDVDLRDLCDELINLATPLNAILMVGANV